MDSFLDSCVILNFLEFNYIKGEIKKRCFDYVDSHNGKIILCFYVVNEISRVLMKREVQYKEILKKKISSDYKLGSEGPALLNREDLLYAEKLYHQLKGEDVDKLKDKFNSQISYLRITFKKFIKTKVLEILLKEKEIDESLVKIIREFIEKYTDCKVLASVLQIQKNREIFLFVTSDRHFDPNGYNFLKNEPRLKDYLFPKLKNLLFEG